MGIAEPIACLTVPCDAGRLSPNRNRGRHWGDVRRLTATARLAALAAYLEAGRPEVEGAVSVAITLRRAARLDPDSALASCKAVVDGLFRRRDLGHGLTWDDSAAWLEFAPVRQEIAACWKGREEILIIVTPREETP